MANLAINGGKSVVPAGYEVKTDAWPPRDDETFELLKDVYYNQPWSFNSPAEQKFENDFAAYQGAKYGIFMANGTVTLECSLLALGVGPGDEVIVPALTWMATALAATYVGATPVIVDIDPDTLCMDPAQFEAAITPKTKAVIPVHAYGSTADLEKIIAIARRHGLFVIEDCAHSHGTVWNGRGTGSWGDVGSFSFQETKTMASGEGGICLTNDAELARKIFMYKHIGYDRNARQGQASGRPPVGMLCHNYRCTAFQAAILNGQMKTIRQRIARYDENANIIRKALENVPGVRMQAAGRLSKPQAYYSIHFLFDGPEFADIPQQVLVQASAAEGIELSNCTHGPVYKAKLFNLRPEQYRIFGGETCPVCEEKYKHTIGTCHQIIGQRETAEFIAQILCKLGANAQELRDYAQAHKDELTGPVAPPMDNNKH